MNFVEEMQCLATSRGIGVSKLAELCGFNQSWIASLKRRTKSTTSRYNIDAVVSGAELDDYTAARLYWSAGYLPPTIEHIELTRAKYFLIKKMLLDEASYDERTNHNQTQ